MLDMDLDSVIKKQKESRKDRGYKGNKRSHFETPSEDHEEEEGNFRGKHRYNKFNLSRGGYHGHKRPKHDEEGEGEGDAEQNPGYKGKKGAYFDPMMGYGGYGAMYGGYPGMYMDPYMMGGYGGYGYKPFKKTFKNKSLIVKKDEKGKKEEPAENPSAN